MASSHCLRLAGRMASLEPSATLAMAARASALAASGADVIDLSVGEPDFPTPDHICRAAEAAIRSGKTKYTPAAVAARREQGKRTRSAGPGPTHAARVWGWC